MVVTTFTSTAPAERAAALLPLFEGMLRSVRVSTTPRQSLAPSLEPPDTRPYRGSFAGRPRLEAPELVPMPGVRSR